MSLDKVEERVVHFPQYKDVFQFDSEVSLVFPDMAVRSIPLYEESHRLHISLFREEIASSEHVTFVDVGASRGQFFKQLCNQFQIDPQQGTSRFTCVAIDQSMPMLKMLSNEMPWVTTVEADAAHLIDLPYKADYICMFYLLQFLQHDSQKIAALTWAYRNLAEGGVLFIGQKEKEEFGFERRLAEEYYRFRMRNGYTREEIAAKTQALKGSMWPSSKSWTETLTEQAGFKAYVETTRWLQFSTAFCVK